MSNHLHLVCRTNPPFQLSHFIRDFKKHTSKQITATIGQIGESRREWLLHRFSYAAHSTGRAKEYKVWTDSNHAIYLDDHLPLFQKIDYIHNNPVKQEIVEHPHHYLYSSAPVYAGEGKGLVKVTVLER
jgi:REP element-mobilizing transposase RayT